MLERIGAFFAERTAGPFEVWTLWSIPGLAEAGTPSEPVPCMIRDAGGSAPRPPAELTIVEAHDQTTVSHADGLINGVYGAGSAPGTLLTPGCLDERLRV